MTRPVRLAVRAVLVHQGRLLLVNAWKGRDHLWCAPGGGAEPHASLPDNLIREVAEETGLTITVGAPCLVNEFHAPEDDYHQAEVFFRCGLVSGTLSGDWQDPEGIVSRRRWVTRAEAEALTIRPRSLVPVAFDGGAPIYDPLEPILR